jgi:RNA polymerase sigma-70 factor (ECF subfamily)
MLNEKELIRKCLKKDERALSELYNKFASGLYGICLRYAGNEMDAQDLLHDGFLKALNNLKNFRHEGSFEGWLRRLMVNTAINNYRKNKTINEKIKDVEVIPDTEFADEDVFSKFSSDELLSLVQQMPQGYRIVFNLYVLEGYKHNEIAEMLDITESTSRTQLLKARKQLQTEVKKLYNEVEY